MDQRSQLTGYPSIDKPWLKYYSDEAIKANLPHMTALEYLKAQNKCWLDYPAVDGFDEQLTYRDLFDRIDEIACSLLSHSIGKGDIILAMLPPIADVAVCAAPDPKHENALVPICFVVLDKTTSSGEAAERINNVCNSLPAYARPERYIYVDKFPMTPIGKVDYSMLEEEASSRSDFS